MQLDLHLGLGLILGLVEIGSLLPDFQPFMGHLTNKDTQLQSAISA